MKRFLSVLACFAISGVSLHRAFAQEHTAPRARTAVVHRSSGYLGVGVAEIDDERAKTLKLKETRGVEIKSVEPGSPAAKAGLREGDAVLEYNGQPVEGVEQFIRMVGETPTGRKVTMQIIRNGGPQTLVVTIAARTAPDWGGAFELQIPEAPEAPFSVAPMPPPVVIPDMPRPMLSWRNAVIGIEAEALNPQLADFFGVKDGALVRSVAKNSPAEKAGMKAGDVVTKVNGADVSSAREISSQVRAAGNTRSIPFVVVRNHREMTLDVKPGGGAWSDENVQQF